MAVWYSRKPIRLGAIKDKIFYRVTCDTVAEYRTLQVRMTEECPASFYREKCRTGSAATDRTSGRPLFHVESSAVDWIEDDLEGIEVPDGYLEILIYRLKRQFAEYGGEDLTPRQETYFRKKFSSLIRELNLGKIGPDGSREPPDAIRRPVELDDTTEEDDPAFVAKVKRRVSMIKILNGWIENLDLGQRSPLNLSVEPTETEIEKWIPRKKRIVAQKKANQLEDLADLPPWKRAAIERGW
jgi:hypothetical protein